MSFWRTRWDYLKRLTRIYAWGIVICINAVLVIYLTDRLCFHGELLPSVCQSLVSFLHQ